VLERVAREVQLDDARSIDGVIAAIRSGVQVSLPDSITPGSAGGTLSADARAQLDSFYLSYAAPTGDQAQRIANALADAFVQESSKSQELRAEDTSQFIARQLQASQERLDTLRERLRTAKEAYMGRLPEQTDANLRMVAALQQQLQSTSMQISSEQDRLSAIERQIDETRQRALQPMPADTSGTAVTTTQAKVADLRRQLNEANLLYTAKHPEVQRLKEELASAERQMASEASKPESDRLAPLQANPAYRQLLADREAAQLRINALRRAEEQARRQVASYQARVESAPMVEQQIAPLEGEYDLETQKYASLSAKRQEALIAEDLARQRGGQRFHVLFAAGLPTTPVSPNAARIMLMALVLGFCLGGAGVVGREYFDRAVYDARSLQDEFAVPVLGEISRIRRIDRAS
jgi:uncharacterized protein involved in exopolysaccharide biosynthesis